MFDCLYEVYTDQGIKNDEKHREELYKRITYDLHDQLGFDREYALIKDKVFQKLKNKAKAEIQRLNRFEKKAMMFKEYWTHFGTITFSDEVMDEATFEKKIRKLLSNSTNRSGWVISGKFERGEVGGRLHFHFLARILPGTSFSKIEQVKEYNPLTKRMEKRWKNVELEEKFGRTDFAPINRMDLLYGNVAEYVSKYENKSSGKTYYSRGIPTGFTMDVLEEEIACEKKTEVVIVDKETEQERTIENIRYILSDQTFKDVPEETFDVKLFAKRRKIQSVA
ncbi:MAG: hypothetical protein IJ735_00970 [Clostridia bacterium]|nr:hypothetical protein [Clostridia bacterium]